MAEYVWDDVLQRGMHFLLVAQPSSPHALLFLYSILPVVCQRFRGLALKFLAELKGRRIHGFSIVLSPASNLPIAIKRYLLYGMLTRSSKRPANVFRIHVL